MFLTSPPPATEQDGEDKISFKFWKTGYLDVMKQRKTFALLILHHSFNVFFSITAYNFLTTGSKLQHVPSIIAFFTSIWSLHSYTAHRSYRNHAKEISGNFKDLVRVGLAVLKNIVIFWRFQNGSVNLFGITSEESWFLIF